MEWVDIQALEYHSFSFPSEVLNEVVPSHHWILIVCLNLLTKACCVILNQTLRIINSLSWLQSIYEEKCWPIQVICIINLHIINAAHEDLSYLCRKIGVLNEVVVLNVESWTGLFTSLRHFWSQIKTIGSIVASVVCEIIPINEDSSLILALHSHFYYSSYPTIPEKSVVYDLYPMSVFLN